MQTKTEEIWNTASHGIGVLLGIVGLILLLVYDTGKTPYSSFSISLYALSIIILYAASSIYHAISNVEWKNRLRKIDHISIYLLIAGTYTPVALISLEQTSGWMIFWIVWGIAGIGTILKLFFTGRFEILSVLLYLIMGWLIVIDFSNLMSLQSSTGINLLMLGGAFYTLGIVFYVIEKIPYNHVIWHFFVLGGSISHFFFIFLDVI
ncbi:hemolysin III [Ulvibacter sp. MAR_2010_11]|uniref:PAQR family membrane homeostasis protein TrhA n=1 Tax=Ulvibacter sp. MAR_2010_11 TaxID=1250229 RepID=UPI000C2CB5DA|nr:hemolysin III family protein [Ulvibacter sp. MAR_2010_11]PKA84326.1 hemolysin III [Ulvibacter sp. MAR_2010_11]